MDPTHKISYFMLVFMVMMSRVEPVISSIFNESTVTTIENVDFESKKIMDIMAHSDGTVLIATPLTIWSINLELPRPSKLRIVGGLPQTTLYNRPVGGYREGYQMNAQFREIRSIFAINDTHLLVTDTGNNCLRQVNLRTRTTSRYIGVCTGQGFEDGPRLEARFDGPWKAIIARKMVLVTDRYNDAIRMIEDSEVGTFAQGGSYIRQPTAMVKAYQHIYVTVELGIVEIDLGESWDRPKRQRMIVNRENFGVALLSISEDILFASDTERGNIQVVDIKKNVVNDDICKSQVSGGFVNERLDGDIRSCKFVKVTSMGLYGGKILIGERRSVYLRKLNIPLLTSPGNRIRCPSDMDLTVRGETVKVNWKPPAQGETGLECRECPSTHNELKVKNDGGEEQEFEYRYLYKDYQWNTEPQCRFKIKVRHDPDLAEQEMSPLLIGISVTCGFLFLLLVAGLVRLCAMRVSKSRKSHRNKEFDRLPDRTPMNSLRYMKQDNISPSGGSLQTGHSPQDERMWLQHQESNYEAIDSRSVLPERYRNRGLPRPAVKLPTGSTSSDVHDYDYADKKTDDPSLSPISQYSQPNDYCIEPGSPVPSKKEPSDPPVISRQQSGYITFSVAEPGQTNKSSPIYE